MSPPCQLPATFQFPLPPFHVHVFDHAASAKNATATQTM
jgi:hypothetical protein